MKTLLWAAAVGANVANANVAFNRGGPDMKAWGAEKSAAAASEAALAAVEAKQAAVNKVISMLQTLREQVIDEGDKEAHTYNKFGCFCKDTTSEKTGEIKKGQDEQTRLAALLNELSGEATGREAKDNEIDALQGKIQKTEEEKAANAKKFAKDKAEYERDLADLESALYGLEGAMKELKASKEPSLVQIRNIVKKIRPAALLADAMGLGSSATQQAAASLLQQPEVPMENYKFHSDDIIGTLEKLFDDFRQEKNTLDADFLKVTVKDHEEFQQLKHDELQALNVDLESTKKEREKLIAQIESTNAELTTTSAQLLDDQEYLKSLASMCSKTAQTYDQRTRVRSDEISALTVTLGILSGQVSGNTTAATVRLVQQVATVRKADAVAQDPTSMQALEFIAEAADAGAPSLLQEAQVQRHLRGISTSMLSEPDGRVVVAEVLEDKGRMLKSTALTALASAIKATGGKDPFAKIKILIQELIERLQHEAAKDADQKGWCTKATADAEQKRMYAMDEVEELNAEMAELEAKRDQLADDLSVLQKEIQEIKKEAAETISARSEEKAENADTVATAKSGLDAVNQAIDIMNKFYKTASKETVEFSAIQQSPDDEAPGAGFKIGEAYTGAQGDQGGIVGMMEVIQSDFKRTIKETEHAEKVAEKEHQKFMTKTGVSLAEKDVVHNEKTKYKTDAEDKVADADASLTDETNTLNTAVQELLELKKACVDTGMSYEERVARREDEIAALNKADCILEAYAKYGPDGAGEQC